MSTGLWTRAISIDELKRAGGRAVVRIDSRQIAVFRTEEGLFACNNRCPHQGFPLCEGTIDGDKVLTCNWHNWKFDLFTGTNVLGGDHLRVYPIEERNGDVWVNVLDPPAEERKKTVLANLCDAFDDHDYSRIARELARLRKLRAKPLEAIRAAIGWSYDRFQFGMGHAYASAADWLTLHEENPRNPEAKLICQMEILGYIAHDVRREKIYPYTAIEEPYDEQAFVEAIEVEDESTAVSYLRGGLASKKAFADFEPALTQAAFRHYSDFGHSLIYVTKVEELIGYLGRQVETQLLLALTRALIFATREDRIPMFRGYSEAQKSWSAGFKPSFGRFKAPTIEDYRGIDVSRALALTVEYKKASPHQLFLSLLGANAANMLAFDLSYQDHVDRNFAANVSWLDFTHGITFANAVRRQCEKFPEHGPAGLLQLACFSGRNATFTTDNVNLDKWRVDDPETFFKNALDRMFDHGQAEYIVSAHLLKTLVAAREEVRWALANDGAETAAYIAAAINRFLNSPLKRKHVRRTARQAADFVAKEI